MEIMSRRQAATAAGISERTLDRMYLEGIGPPRIQLSRRRVAYDVALFQQWLASRTFTSQAAVLAAAQQRKKKR